MNQIQDWQRTEMEGGVLPPIQRFNEKADRRKRKRAWMELREREKEMREEGRGRAKDGGEVGEEEAVMKIRRATAGMLAHAGFEGQLTKPSTSCPEAQAIEQWAPLTGDFGVSE